MDILLTTSIAAVTEFLKRLQGKDFRGAGVILLAGVVGAAAGLLSVQGLTVETGIIAGLGIAGIHTIAKQVG